MNRLASYGGAALMLAGMAILAFVGIAYVMHPQPQARGWSKTQTQNGKEIASKLPTQLPSRTVGAHRWSPGSEAAVRVVIPRIGVNAPVVDTPAVDGVWQVADWAVGHLMGSPNPGAVGNMALSAHDDIEGEIFKRLDELGPGDVIKLYTRHMVYTYVVVSQQVVDPSDTQVLDQTERPVVTLISCTPYWVDTQRLVVQAVLHSSAVR